MKFTSSSIIIGSGIAWFSIGLYLLFLGIHFLVQEAKLDLAQANLTLWVSQMTGSVEGASLLLLVLGLGAGSFKGKYVFKKTVQRVVNKVKSIKGPIRLSQVYGIGYLGLILGMMGLGMGMKWLHVPLDIRGMIDVAVGSALIQGALSYFKLGYAERLR